MAIAFIIATLLIGKKSSNSTKIAKKFIYNELDALIIVTTISKIRIGLLNTDLRFLGLKKCKDGLPIFDFLKYESERAKENKNGTIEIKAAINNIDRKPKIPKSKALKTLPVRNPILAHIPNLPKDFDRVDWSWNEIKRLKEGINAEVMNVKQIYVMKNCQGFDSIK